MICCLRTRGLIVTGQLSSLTRLSTLSHLDLTFVGISEIIRSNTKSAGSNLLDRGAHGIAIGKDVRTLGIFTTFSCVGFTAEPVRGDCQG